MTISKKAKGALFFAVVAAGAMVLWRSVSSLKRPEFSNESAFKALRDALATEYGGWIPVGGNGTSWGDISANIRQFVDPDLNNPERPEWYADHNNALVAGFLKGYDLKPMGANVQLFAPYIIDYIEQANRMGPNSSSRYESSVSQGQFIA